MIIYNDTFRWDGKRNSGKTNICWWPGAYKIKIIDVSLITENVRLLKPYICIFTNTGDGTSIVNHTQNFIKRLSEEFGLKITDTLFVEHFPERNLFEVVTVTKSFKVGVDTIYTVKRRHINANEINFLEQNLLV